MDIIYGTLVDNKVASRAMGKKRDWSINGVSQQKENRVASILTSYTRGNSKRIKDSVV